MNRQRLVLTLCVAVVFSRAALPCPVSSSLVAAETVRFSEPEGAARNVRLLEGLRSRKLYDLAEQRSQALFESADRESRERIELAIERVRTAAERAAVLSFAERPIAWKKARTLAAELIASESKHPHAILLRVQDGLTLVWQGDQLRRESEVGAGDATTLASARETLEEAVRTFDKLRTECDAKALERRRLGDDKPAGKSKGSQDKAQAFTLDQWQSLSRDATKHLAGSRRLLAECFKEGTDDRTAMLVSASEALKKTLAGASLDEPWAAELRVQWMACSRAASDWEELATTFALVDRDDVPATIRGRAIAEMVSGFVAQQKTKEARALLERAETKQIQPRPPELSEAVLQTTLAEASVALAQGETDAAGELQKQALALSKEIERQHGVYWGRRAEQRIVRSDLRGAGGDAGAELTAKLADNLVVNGSYVDAVRAYDEAAESSTVADQRFTMLYKAALVYSQKLMRYDLAAERLRQLATGDPKHPKAAEAHLLGAWNAAQSVRKDPTLAELYTDYLAEHIKLWPNSETANQARLWLGQWWHAQGEWSKSLDALLDIPSRSPHCLESLATIAADARELWPAASSSAADLADRRSRLLDFLQAAVDSPANEPAALAAVLTQAELVLSIAPEKLSETESALRERLAVSKEATAAWKSTAQSLLVAVLASQPAKREQAIRVLREMGTASPAQLAELLSRLDAIARREGAALKKELAPLQLEAARLALRSPDKLSPGELRDVSRVEAAALATTGDREKAIARYATLVKNFPDDGTLQEDYAQLLIDSGDPPRLRLALDRWRIIAAKSEKRSVRWFRAKHRIALAEYRLGDKAAAALLLRSVLETPPGVTDPALQREYRDLLSQCE